MSERLVPEDLPWGPIYTVTRSSRPEITVHGVVYIWVEDRKLYSNVGISLLRVGNTRFPLWGRSLLKPWQFMTVYPELKRAYPQLTDEHYAMMLSSHAADARQIGLLEEILAIGGLLEDTLQCPTCNAKQAAEGMARRVLNHPCSGKHLGHLLYLKARNLPTETYLHPETEPYRHLEGLLGYLLNREDFDVTTDGCGMPNFALSAVEMAQLYHALVMPAAKDLLRQAPEELCEILSYWDEISALIRKHPELVGGLDRLDTRLMQGNWLPQPHTVPIIAKEGADGLLCLAIGPNSVYADGLGIYVKLAAGYQSKHLEAIAFEILSQLGLATSHPEHRKITQDGQSVVETEFHFQLEPAAAKT